MKFETHRVVCYDSTFRYGASERSGLLGVLGALGPVGPIAPPGIEVSCVEAAHRRAAGVDRDDASLHLPHADPQAPRLHEMVCPRPPDEARHET